MGNYAALFIFGGFCVLASYSAGRIDYGQARHYAAAKPVALWRTHKAAVIADIWGLKPEELETATNIFGQ